MCQDPILQQALKESDEALEKMYKQLLKYGMASDQTGKRTSPQGLIMNTIKVLHIQSLGEQESKKNG